VPLADLENAWGKAGSGDRIVFTMSGSQQQ
jgi:hypothetical protein